MIKKLYRFMFGTLRGRLIISVAVVNAVMMALFVADLTMRQREILLQHQIDHATALSQMLANSATGLIVTDKIAEMQQLLDAQQSYPGLLFVMFTDQQGHILAQSGQSDHERSLTALPRQARQSLLSGTQSLVDVATPVKLGERHMGWARVGLGQQETGQKLTQITRSGITYALAAIFISSIIAWLMGRLITGRLYVIQKTIHQVRAGNSLARSSISGNDEAAMMAHEFNAMLDSMAERVMLAELAAEIGLSLTKQNDLPHVLNECAEALVRHLDVAFARIWSFNPKENVLELQASAGMYTRIDGSHSRVPFGKFKIGLIAKQREPHITNSLIGDPQVTDQEWARREGMIAFAGHPLLVDDKLVGVMGMFSRRALTDITIKALAAVANAIAIGIERKLAAEQLNQLAAIVKSSDDAITGKTLDGIITSWNRGAEKIYGYTESEMLGKSVTTLLPAGKINELAGTLERIKAGEHIEHYEALRLRKDGVEIQMSLTVSPVRDAGGRIVAASTIGRDITEHKRAEETLHRLNRGLRAIGDCNQVLMRARDEQALLSEICDIICTEAGYHMAWVGFAENSPSKSITPAGWAGAEDGYLSEARFCWDDTDLGRGPAGVAIRSGSSSSVQDITLAPHAAPWREMALQRGYRSTLALPLKDESKNSFGVICIYSTKPNTFSPDEIRLLEELAGDLSFGVMLIRSRAERKLAEQALKLASGYNRSLIEASLDPLVTIGPDGTITDVNLATETATGYGRKELIGTDFADYFTEPPRARAGYQQVFQEGKVRDYALDLRHRDGGIVPVLYNASLFRDEEGRVKGVFAAARDITELKQAENEIRYLKNYLVNIIDSMPSMLVGMDRDEHITQWNLQAKTATGITAAEAIGKPIAQLLPDFTPWIVAVREEIRQRRPVSIEKLLVEKEGKLFYYDLTLYPLIANCIEGTVVRIEDVTERTRIQELMIQTEKMMSVGGLAAGMAHEINNPLGIITQAAQNIERRVSPDLPANQKAAQETGVPMEQINSYFQQRQIPEFIASIREAAARASRIIANILRFSRQADSVMQPVSLSSIMDQAVELAANDYDLKKKFDFRSIEIIRNYQPELPILSVVATEIEQVLLNLLKNAAQAMISNPPERKPCIMVRLRREERYAVLEVEDNGPGMTEEIRRRVFEPFFTTKEPGIGTGLGLSVSYMIVTQNHKGLMEVVSKPDKGARFSIRLPLEKECGHVR